MPNVRVILLEGADGAGKTSLRKLLHERYPDIITIERFTPGMYAYGKFFKRPIRIEKLLALEKAAQDVFELVPIFLYCDVNELYKRYIRGHHIYSFTRGDLETIQNLIIEFIKKFSTIDWVKIDNTSLPPEKVFEIVEVMFAPWP